MLGEGFGEGGRNPPRAQGGQGRAEQLRSVGGRQGGVERGCGELAPLPRRVGAWGIQGEVASDTPWPARAARAGGGLGGEVRNDTPSSGSRAEPWRTTAGTQARSAGVPAD